MRHVDQARIVFSLSLSLFRRFGAVQLDFMRFCVFGLCSFCVSCCQSEIGSMSRIDSFLYLVRRKLMQGQAQNEGSTLSYKAVICIGGGRIL